MIAMVTNTVSQISSSFIITLYDLIHLRLTSLWHFDHQQLFYIPDLINTIPQDIKLLQDQIGNLHTV